MAFDKESEPARISANMDQSYKAFMLRRTASVSGKSATICSSFSSLPLSENDTLLFSASSKLSSSKISDSFIPFAPARSFKTAIACLSDLSTPNKALSSALFFVTPRSLFFNVLSSSLTFVSISISRFSRNTWMKFSYAVFISKISFNFFPAKRK